MNTTIISNDQISTVWGWCTEAYLHHGIRLTFPHNTDQTKTYQWRYVRSIVSKFNEWDFDEQTAKRFIDIAIGHAKEAGVLRKGLAVLHQANMMAVCYQELKQEINRNYNTIDVIKQSHGWLTAQINQSDPLQVLLHRVNQDAFCNLTIWYRSSKISPLYLAISRTCGKALSQLEIDDKNERHSLPSRTELFLMNGQFLSDTTNLRLVKEILGNDWRKSCPLRY